MSRLKRSLTWEDIWDIHFTVESDWYQILAMRSVQISVSDWIGGKNGSVQLYLNQRLKFTFLQDSGPK